MNENRHAIASQGSAQRLERATPRRNAGWLCVLGAAALTTLVGCDAVKKLAGKSDDGGAGASSGGGLLSFLDSSFEGEITMRLQSSSKPGDAATVKVGMKSPKFRFDVTDLAKADKTGAAGMGVENGAAFILDPPAKKGYMLMPSQKMAMVIDFDQAAKLGGMAPGAGPGKPGMPSTPSMPTDVPTIDKTGKKDTVAGYACDEWKVTSKSGRADLCVADGIRWIGFRDLAAASPGLGAVAFLGDVDRFPLRVVAYDPDGKESGRVEATKVEKKKLEDAAFVVPTDYRVMDMAAMMQGFMGAAAAGSAGKIPGFPVPKR